MKKGLGLLVICIAIFLGACQKTTQKVYNYEIYEIGTKYLATAQPSDSFHYIDSGLHTISTYRGDTINHGPDASFFLNGNYYMRRSQFFEVYQH